MREQIDREVVKTFFRENKTKINSKSDIENLIL